MAGSRSSFWVDAKTLSNQLGQIACNLVPGLHLCQFGEIRNDALGRTVVRQLASHLFEGDDAKRPHVGGKPALFGFGFIEYL